MEQGILLAIEEAVRPIDGVKDVTSTARESSGTVMVELNTGSHPLVRVAGVEALIQVGLEQRQRFGVLFCFHKSPVFGGFNHISWRFLYTKTSKLSSDYIMLCCFAGTTTYPACKSPAFRYQ